MSGLNQNAKKENKWFGFLVHSGDCFNPKTMKSLVPQSLGCFLSTRFVLLPDHPLAIIVVQENKRQEGFKPLHPKSRSFENMIDTGNEPSTKGGSCFSSCPILKDHIRPVQ